MILKKTGLATLAALLAVAALCAAPTLAVAAEYAQVGQYAEDTPIAQVYVDWTDTDNGALATNCDGIDDFDAHQDDGALATTSDGIDDFDAHQDDGALATTSDGIDDFDAHQDDGALATTSDGIDDFDAHQDDGALATNCDGIDDFDAHQYDGALAELEGTDGQLENFTTNPLAAQGATDGGRAIEEDDPRGQGDMGGALADNMTGGAPQPWVVDNVTVGGLINPQQEAAI